MTRVLKFRLATLILVFVILLILLEVISRVAGFSNLVLYEKLPGVGYRMAPNQDANFLNIHVKTNGAGFRGKSFSEIDKEKTIIYFAGDSVLYGGLYIPQDKIFTSLIEEKLLQNHENAFVINSGCNAYSPGDMCRMVELFLKDHSVHKIVFHLLPGGFSRAAIPSYTPGISTFPETQTFFALSAVIRIARYNLSVHYPHFFRWLRLNESLSREEDWAPV